MKPDERQKRHNLLKKALTESAKFMARKHLAYKTENNVLVNLHTKDTILIDKQLDKVMTARRHLRYGTDFYQMALKRLKSFERRNYEKNK